MTGVVVYKSKTGFTKKYAEWIAEELQYTLLENNKLDIKELLKYDTIIYGGGRYASSIAGLDLIKKNYELLKDKNIVIWTTGYNPGRKDDLDAVWNCQFTPEQLQNIKTYYLRGGFDYNKLNKGYKLLMKILMSKLKNDKNPSEEARGLIHAYEKPQDYRKKENILPLIEYVRSL